MDVTGHHYQNGQLIAWVTLPSGTSTAWNFAHGNPATPGVTSALDGLAAAIRDAAMLEMMTASDVKVPDAPPPGKPCRICDVVNSTNEPDRNGHVFCRDHRGFGAPS